MRSVDDILARGPQPDDIVIKLNKRDHLQGLLTSVKLTEVRSLPFPHEEGTWVWFATTLQRGEKYCMVWGGGMFMGHVGPAYPSADTCAALQLLQEWQSMWPTDQRRFKEFLKGMPPGYGKILHGWRFANAGRLSVPVPMAHDSQRRWYRFRPVRD